MMGRVVRTLVLLVVLGLLWWVLARVRWLDVLMRKNMGSKTVGVFSPDLREFCSGCMGLELMNNSVVSRVFVLVLVLMLIGEPLHNQHCICRQSLALIEKIPHNNLPYHCFVCETRYIRI